MPFDTPLPVSPDVERAVSFVHDHLHDPRLGAATLQDALGLRASGFRTRFRFATGRPLAAFIEAARIERACALLRAGALVGDAALSVGYRSHETFTRAFQRATGETPSAFRARAAGALAPAAALALGALA